MYVPSAPELTLAEKSPMQCGVAHGMLRKGRHLVAPFTQYCVSSGNVIDYVPNQR